MDVCNMQCPFCFIPFSGEKPNSELTKLLLKECKQLGIKVITFGGGDPLNHSDFLKLSSFAKSLGFIVHVDTNTINLRLFNINELVNNVDVIGIPIDGSNAILHNEMRSSKSHFNLVIDNLKRLSDKSIKIKINTVLSAINYKDLQNIKALISSFSDNIYTWSIYQYWPLHHASSVKQYYELSEENFFDAISNLHDTTKFKIEVNPFISRHKTYLFSSPNGELYIHDPQNIGEYLFIGSIFELGWKAYVTDNTIETTIRDQVRERYIETK